MYWLYTIPFYIIKIITYIALGPFYIILLLWNISITPFQEYIERKRDEIIKKRNWEKYISECEQEAKSNDENTLNQLKISVFEKVSSANGEDDEILNDAKESSYVENSAYYDTLSVEHDDFNEPEYFLLSYDIKLKPKKWLYPTTYKKTDFKKIWSVHTLIKAIVELEYSHICFNEDTDNFEYDVKRARVASVLRAYTGLSFDLVLNNLSAFSYGAFCDNVTEEKAVSIIDQFKSVIGDCHDIDFLEREKHDVRYFRDVFHTVYQYRVAIGEAMDVYSGIIESRSGWSMGIRVAESIYNSVLEKSNEKIENMLILLLGDSFNMTFSEKNLIRLYNYPTVTDDQIIDWKCDNL